MSFLGDSHRHTEAEWLLCTLHDLVGICFKLLLPTPVHSFAWQHSMCQAMFEDDVTIELSWDFSVKKKKNPIADRHLKFLFLHRKVHLWFLEMESLTLPEDPQAGTIYPLHSQTQDTCIAVFKGGSSSSVHIGFTGLGGIVGINHLTAWNIVFCRH